MRTLTLPFPPSVNHYFRNVGRGRTLLSKRAREYRTAVAVAVLTQGRAETIFGPIAVEIVAHAPDRKRRDLDNLFKGVLDSLAHAGVYSDDSQIQDLRVRWGHMIKLGRLDVEIRRIE